MRARLVRQAGNLRWSSYRATVGTAAAPAWFESRAILSAFGNTEPQAVERYIRFVAEGKEQPSPGVELKTQVFLGADAFVMAMRRKLPRSRDVHEVPGPEPSPLLTPAADTQ